MSRFSLAPEYGRYAVYDHQRRTVLFVDDPQGFIANAETGVEASSLGDMVKRRAEARRLAHERRKRNREHV